MAQQPNGNGLVGRASLYVSLVSAAAIVVGAFIWVGGIASEVASNAKDLEELNRRLSKIETDVRGVQVDQAVIQKNDCQVFVKIETQMGIVETVINEIHIEQIRDHGSLWLKLFGQSAPSIYYEIKIPHEITPC